MDRKLIDYLPPILKEYREFKQIMGTEQDEVSALWSASDNALNDQFIWDATENGVKRWEGILNLYPKASDTLGDRKFRILTKINQQSPFTLTNLKQQLTTLCGEDGYVVILLNNLYKLTVRLALTRIANYDDVKKLLEKVAPANMIVDLSLLYNQHSALATYTHAQLSSYTYDQIRNEVLT